MSNLKLNVGDCIPNFSIEATGEKTITQEDFLGKYTVVYFYPKDSTPGCTTEGLDFTSLHSEFSQLNTQIFGVSMDSMKRHDNFKTKQNFSFELLSDPEGEFCNLFGTYQLKKNFGKEYMGIVRTTFLISPEGKVIQVWPNVKVKDHAKNVLEFLKTNA
ncbi:peroxiredoxin [Thiomicrorhabdus indica]|uniref:peroxiredoxin n=1 Tax=Thiomicrorhabdus indica TaxID=2267253 RepID=UPI00102D8D17|nr:peroxiredoxin [Thiomicrorhabdus indica]